MKKTRGQKSRVRVPLKTVVFIVLILLSKTGIFWMIVLWFRYPECYSVRYDDYWIQVVCQFSGIWCAHTVRGVTAENGTLCDSSAQDTVSLTHRIQMVLVSCVPTVGNRILCEMLGFVGDLQIKSSYWVISHCSLPFFKIKVTGSNCIYNRLPNSYPGRCATKQKCNFKNSQEIKGRSRYF
jgi:hypothetical protein